MLTLTLTSSPGDSVEETLTDAVKIARKLFCCVRIDIQNVVVLCNASSDPKEITEKFNKAIENNEPVVY